MPPQTPCEHRAHQRPLAERAEANRPRSSRPGWAALLLGIALLPGCHRDGVEGADSTRSETAAGTAGQAPSPDLAELITVMTPLDKAVTSDISDQRLLRGRELLGKLRAGPREVGLEALALMRDVPVSGSSRLVDVDRALLDVAAHAAPADARPLLEALLTQYGAALELRTEACLLLAETSPERAIELLEPMVAKAHPNRTQPPAEFIVRSWVTACDHTGRSPVPELADVATNLFADETARILAVKELGHRPEPLALQSLQAILIESTGDGYLRRMAAQGLRDSLPKESGCEIFERVASREADLNFAQFLADLLQKHCR
jgi:hypothetical protein